MHHSSARDAGRAWVLGSLLAAAVLGLLGCGGDSFVVRRADNLSAYYNTFYNARKAFAEGTRSLSELEQPVDLTTYLPVFVAPERVENKEAFGRAIKKSANLLREHPRSKWVDDALLMIGKAYFYQQNYVGAERKFREVIDRGGSLTGEARFWLGRTLVSSREYAAADQHLAESLKEEGLAERWAAHMQLLLGDLKSRQGAWPAAAEALAEGVRGVEDEQTRARAFFLRGQVLETMGQHANAAQAYRRAAEERPRYELAYAAETSALRAAARGGRGRAVLEQLRKLYRDDKNESKRAELALLRGQLYQAQGRPAEARRQYNELLYRGEERTGAVVPSSAVRGRVHYALAVLHRDAYNDFTRAAAHFDTAATTLSSSAQATTGLKATHVPPYAVTDSRRLADRYARVAEASEQVARLDSLLRLGTMDEAAFDTFVDSLRRAQAEAQRAANRQEARRQAEQRFQRDGGVEGQRGPSETAGATAGNGASFLFHEDPARVQQARLRFVRRWGERPRAPNWRRRAAISGQAAEAPALGEPSEEVGPEEEIAAAALPRVDVSAVPRTPARLREMRAERASAQYNLGNALLLAAGRPDSAAVWFRRVLKQEADSSVTRRARYALAEAERAAGHTEEARQSYRQVIQEQPGTKLARRARRRLAEGDAPATASQETLSSRAASPTAALQGTAEAEDAYAQAYRQWQEGAYEAALQQMIDVAATYPEAPTAPRALLATARIYIEWSRRTGRPLAAVLPVQVPDTLRAALLGPAADTADGATADTARIAVTDTAGGAAAADTASMTAADTVGRAAADTAGGAVADTAAAPGVGVDPQGALALDHLLAGLARRYPDAPHAARARRMLRALRERRPQRFAARSPAPGAASTASDAAAADTAAADTSVQQRRQEAVRSPGEGTARDEAPAERPRPKRLRVGEAAERRSSAEQNEGEDVPLPDSASAADSSAVDSSKSGSPQVEPARDEAEEALPSQQAADSTHASGSNASSVSPSSKMNSQAGNSPSRLEASWRDVDARRSRADRSRSVGLRAFSPRHHAAGM